MSSYRVAPIFAIRVAGAPFDHLKEIATPRIAIAARTLLVRRSEFEEAKDKVELLLRTRGHGLSEELFHAWRRAIRSGTMPPGEDWPSRAFATCWQCASKVALAETDLSHALNRDSGHAREVLLKIARMVLPSYLLFGAEGFGDRILKILADPGVPAATLHRNSRGRERDRLLLLYLQRLSAKNDTFSEFGPTVWGAVDSRRLEFKPRPGIIRRDCFLERWTAHAVANALNNDPAARAELSPRLNPSGRIEKDRFVWTDTGASVPLDFATLQILSVCNGTTPAHLFPAGKEILSALAEQNIIRWRVEVPALVPHAFIHLISEIAEWRDSPNRTRWLELLLPINALAEKFAKTTDARARSGLVDEALRRLHELGADREPARRFLYAAANPIAEECSREGTFICSTSAAEKFTDDAEPWLDLWRDSYAFVASRVDDALRSLLQTAVRLDGVVPLPAFLQHCETQSTPLIGRGLVSLAHDAFRQVKGVFLDKLRERPDAPEWQLTADECHVVRDSFDYPKFDEYTYPSADLQISASSFEEMERGDFQWILSELHPPVALLHHCFYWSCPDRPALSAALASTIFGKPNFHFGFFPADFTAHTTVRLFDALPEHSYFVAPQRGNPKWKTVSPSETEVYLEEESGDVCLRRRGSREHLGSFARAWVIPLGFHPFHFGRAPHMPRLRCGNVIVQRQSWTVALGELGPGNFSGISRDLVLALERLRADRAWPRYVYVRPTEQALRRSGAEGRDKDTKPVFIDLESYLSLEIFYRWLTKSGELEVTEMLPDPDHLCWQEADGRRTFELRTLIVPRP